MTYHWVCPKCGRQVKTIGLATITCPHPPEDGRPPALMERKA